MRVDLRFAVVALLFGGPLQAANSAAPVVFAGRTLFTLEQGIGSFSAAERAQAVSDRLTRVLELPNARVAVAPDEPGASGTEIDAGDVPLLVVTDQDAAAAGSTRQQLAADYARRLQTALDASRKSQGLRQVVFDTLLALLFAALFFATLRLQGVVFRRLRASIHHWRGTRIQGLRIQRVELLSAQKITRILISATRFLQAAAIILICYIFLSLLLGILPETRGISAALLIYVVNTLAVAWHGFAAAIPGLLMIVVVSVGTWYVLKLCRFLFREVQRGHITVSGFYPEWADPTYKLLRILILAFAAIVAFPYVPGGDSPAFKGVSIFFGLLVSLGSAGAVGNVVAGVLLTYTRAFQVGDRVRIADTLGDITERTLLATRLRTIKNEHVTVPNSLVLSGQIFNFSECCRDGALILHTSVTIGYDAPWRQVHELLLAAASRTGRILEDPKPFVLQTALDDFYVSYQLNAYTKRAADMVLTYSELHQNIQDEFNNAGVEICSPHFAAVRDANTIAIPNQYIAKDYVPPSFRVSATGGQSSRSVQNP